MKKTTITERIIAIIMSVLMLLPIISSVSATETVSCLTVDKRLVIIGDSNTVFLKKNNSDIQAARIYARVNATIQETVTAYNYSADGYNSGICQLINALDGSSFDTVVINMGTNNLGSSLTSYKSNYKKLLNKLYGKNPNAVIYCCKILPINANHYGGPYYSAFTLQNVKELNNAVAELQQDFRNQGYDARILDLHTPFSDSNGVLLNRYDSGGGIHLTVSGYKYLNQVIQTALAKGNTNANHSWVNETVQPATCVEAGLQTMYCTVCGAEKSETIAATGMHLWDKGVVTKKATCISTGKRVCTCTSCGTTRSETIPVDSNAHAWELTEVLTEGETYHSSTGLYTCALCSAAKTARLCACEVFSDMPKDSNWAHDPIDWAYFNDITDGTSATTFSPNATVSRAQVVTFLYAFSGKPETSAANPFQDVRKKDYFYDPVRWAADNHITDGTSEVRFSPAKTCTREQIVTFLWAAAGRAESTLEDSPFPDVKAGDYYCDAVRWAYEHDITKGVGGGRFGTGSECTRKQMVSFLFAFAKYLASQEVAEQS